MVLSEDELSRDPQYHSQSIRSWICEKERDEVTEERSVLTQLAHESYTKDSSSHSGIILLKLIMKVF